MPTLDDFLKGRAEIVFEKERKARTKRYDLYDEFDRDPRKYCPECNSVKVRNRTPRHQCEFEGYHCENCDLDYELDYEPIVHHRRR